jgi:Methylase involved in ubiquinone/menaquinone biosynthesis
MIGRRTLRRAVGRIGLSFGRAASLRPLSTQFGFDRGTPIDRRYIAAFLSQHANDIRGHLLEIGDDAYSRCFGRDRVKRQDVLHVRSGHPRATITGDLTNPATLPADTFDCIILTQTLHLVFDMVAALSTLRQSLRPGGVLLVTVPGITPIDHGEWKDNWYWSLTEHALAKLLAGSFEKSHISARSYGNLFAATAFLHGAAVEEVPAGKLDTPDPAYPVIVAARAQT